MFVRKAGMLVGLVAVALSGCGKNNLDCASDDAQSLIIQIAKENSPTLLRKSATSGLTVAVLEQFRAAGNNLSQGDLGEESYSLDAIRLTAKDSTTGALTCAANLHLKLPEHPGGGDAKEPITYKLEITSDDKLYATVFGLK